MAEKWKNAKTPNYETNKDKLYPYSDFPFQNLYKPVKIPICVKNLIEHVDYFGIGKSELTADTRGFNNCYNVNYEYRVVNDTNRKIPNRIPISEAPSMGFSTRNYIKDNSVLTVTVDLDTEIVTVPIAQDIARIVNSERGKVIVYGYDEDEILILNEELTTMKQLFYCPIYLLPDKLVLNYWKTCTRAFLPVKHLKRELYLNVNKGDFEAAVILTGCLTDPHCGGALGDVVYKLLENKVRNVIAYAYKLYNNNYKEVVCEHFPSVFQHIFGGDCMVINNKLNDEALVLEPKTNKVRGDGEHKSRKKLLWKIIPIWDDNNVFFKLYNIASAMYLQLSPKTGENGIRQARGKKDSEEQRDENEKFSFSPLIIENGQVAFNILNCEDNKQLLGFPVDDDTSEVKAAVGQKSVGSVQDGGSCWILTISEDPVRKDEQSDECEDEDFSNIYDYD